MLLITRDRIDSLRADLARPAQIDRCREELRKMLEIKQALLWRADAGTCCAGPVVANSFFAEVQLLEKALEALDKGDAGTAASLLEELAAHADYA
ncbi:MAG: hypothetical protein DRI40_05070 [Chloroflexi bacterium]|nr:MAG: hypothetical protein DRI40_05070 [Chloroflexota bacterium]